MIERSQFHIIPNIYDQNDLTCFQKNYIIINISVKFFPGDFSI